MVRSAEPCAINPRGEKLLRSGCYDDLQTGRSFSRSVLRVGGELCDDGGAAYVHVGTVALWE